MPVFEKLKQTFAGLFAGTTLPPVPPPKVGKGASALPTYLTTARKTDSPLRIHDRFIANTNIANYRNGASTRQTLRDFVASSPDIAASVFAYLRTAITPRYTAVARNAADASFNRDATVLLQQMLVRFDVIKDYTDGFAGTAGLRSIAESWVKDLLTYGSMAGELVLGKDRLPRKIVPISTTTIQFRSDTDNLNPFQKIGGVENDLDIPTFFYVSLDQDLLDAYSSSMLEPGLQPVIFGHEFMNDLRRVVRKAIHPRQVVIVDEEKFKKNVPAEVLHDPKQLTAYMDTMLGNLEQKFNGLNPEDVLVFFDSIGVEYINNGNISLDQEYQTLQDVIDSKTATGVKAMPSTLGHGSGSQNIASSETLLFMKNAEGAVQMKLNEMFSRMLTLALRIFGLDVYVEFKYDTIDLRPDTELESFRALKQSRYLELLSLGMIEDDEACLELTGQLTPVGYTTLSGTHFFDGASRADPAANNYNGSGTGGAGGGPATQNNKTPTGGARGNNKKPAQQAPGKQKPTGQPTNKKKASVEEFLSRIASMSDEELQGLADTHEEETENV